MVCYPEKNKQETLGGGAMKKVLIAVILSVLMSGYSQNSQASGELMPAVRTMFHKVFSGFSISCRFSQWHAPVRLE